MAILYENEFSWSPDLDQEELGGLMNQFFVTFTQGLLDALTQVDPVDGEEVFLNFQFGTRTLEADAESFLKTS